MVGHNNYVSPSLVLSTSSHREVIRYWQRQLPIFLPLKHLEWHIKQNLQINTITFKVKFVTMLACPT